MAENKGKPSGSVADDKKAPGKQGDIKRDWTNRGSGKEGAWQTTDQRVRNPHP